MEFAKRLIAFRRRSGMSQQDLAEAMGVSLRTIQLWELGEATPTTAQVAQLAVILDVKIAALLHDPNRKYAEPNDTARPTYSDNRTYVDRGNYNRTPGQRRVKTESQKLQEKAVIFLVAGVLLLVNIPSTFFGFFTVDFAGHIAFPGYNPTVAIIMGVVCGLMVLAGLASLIVSIVFFSKSGKQKRIEKGLDK